LKEYLNTVSFLFFLLVPFLAYSQKTDKVLLTNNDWITGEIKKLDYGKVNFKTDAAGTIQIKWDHIYQMKSDKYFEISLGRGKKYFGSIDVTDEDENFTMLIITEEEELKIDMNRVVEITPIKNRFWARIDGNLDLGYSYTKGSEVKQWNSSFRIDYRPTNSLTSIYGTSIFTEQPEREPASKQDLGFAYRYFTKSNFAYSAFAGLQQNSELGMDLRSFVGLGMSKSWLRSNLQRLISTIAFIVNEERSGEQTDRQKNFEGLIRTEYHIFRYSDPEIDLTMYFDFFPSFTVKDRYRTDLDIKLKYELFSDFYFGISFYHNLDTKPPESAISTSDWGITTSVGYTF